MYYSMQYGTGNAVTQAKRYSRHVVSLHHQQMEQNGPNLSTKSTHAADISFAFLLLHVWLCEGLSVALLAGLVSF